METSKKVIEKTEYQKIFITNEYDKFKDLLGNREVTTIRVERIKESIKRVGFIPNPIIVNEKYEIIDGQGRKRACQELELPIYYCVIPGIGINECISMNILGSNWTMLDYIKSFAKRGNENYIRLKVLIEQYKDLPFAVIQYLVFDYSTVHNTLMKNQKTDAAVIKAGKLQLSEKDVLRLSEVLDYCRAANEFVKDVGGSRTNMLIGLAFIYTFCGKVNKKQLLRQIKNNRGDMLPCHDLTTIIKQYQDVYNKGKNNKQQVFFADVYSQYKAHQIEKPWLSNDGKEC